MPGPTRSTGNVFEDLGFESEEAALLRVKSRLLSSLASFVAEFDTQADAAAALGVSRPRVSEIKNGHLDKFSTDNLIGLCYRAGLRVPDFDLVPVG
jgi:predicted XRE-type DNA-binding protein